MSRLSILLVKEIRDIFFTKTGLLFLMLVSFITGYSFLTAVELYSEQSLSAVNNPLYARGFEPVPGVFVPTYGGLFVLFSLFLPFVIIPLLSLEKQNGTLAVLIQLPYSFKDILIAKISAAFFFLLMTILLTLPCFILWQLYGGHIPFNELFVLISGYLLYGLFVVSVSFFAAALFESTANASIFSILLIVLSWVIDFGKNMDVSTFLTSLSEWTVTRNLKYFEQGILSFTASMYFVLLCSFFFILAYILLRFDLRIKSKLKRLFATVVLFLLALFISFQSSLNTDMTESHRHLFSPAVTKALQEIPDLEIDVYMKKSDSRFKDYQNKFLNKLLLVRNDIKIRMMTGRELNKNYGLFIYQVNGRQGKTYSNSEKEIFPIIFKLAGVSVGQDNGQQVFPGYPLVIKKEQLTIIQSVFYLVIPLTLISIFVFKNFKLIRRDNND